MSMLSGDHFIADDIFPADVAIVFGMSAWQRPCERAVELYRGGFARTLLFTGGFNQKAGVVEAEAMAKRARAKGVPAPTIALGRR
jgi:vancomycin permeability regulator SanA